MSDKIVYTASDYGVDGRAKESIRFASYNEQEVKDWHNANGSNKKWLSLRSRIVNIEKQTTQAIRRIDGIDRLLLGLNQREAQPPKPLRSKL